MVLYYTQILTRQLVTVKKNLKMTSGHFEVFYGLFFDF